jgi:hypothetical protein
MLTTLFHQVNMLQDKFCLPQEEWMKNLILPGAFARAGEAEICLVAQRPGGDCSQPLFFSCLNIGRK